MVTALRLFTVLLVLAVCALPVAAKGDTPNLGISIAVVIATLIAVGFILESSTRDKMLFSLGVLAVALILTIGFIGRPAPETKYAVIEPLLKTQTSAVFDSNHDSFITPRSNDVVVTQLNSQQGTPVTLTKHYVFSGSTQIAAAADLGLAEIAAAGPTPNPSQFIIAGPSASDPLQQVLVTATIDENGATPISTAPIGMQPSEVFQTIADGTLQTYVTTAENTYIDIQAPTESLTSFTADQTIPAINDIAQATPDTLVGITEDGTLGTVDLGTQAFTPTDVPATDIVRPQVPSTNIVAANPDYIPDNNILIVNPDQTAQFVDVNLATQTNYAPTNLGQVAGTTATLTNDGTLVSVDSTGQYAYRATLNTAAATLQDYERLSLNSVSTVTLADPTQLTQVSPAQLLAAETGENTFNAYAIDVSTYQFEGVLQPNSYYRVLIYATAQPITVQQAAQLQPTAIWYFNNPYDYAVRADREGTADLTTTYISIQMEWLGAAQTADWTPITEPAFADATRTDTFAITPTATQTVTTVAEADACLSANLVCLNTNGVRITSSSQITRTVTTLDQAQQCLANPDWTCQNQYGVTITNINQLSCTSSQVCPTQNVVVSNTLTAYQQCTAVTTNVCRTSYDATTLTTSSLTNTRQVVVVNTVAAADACLHDPTKVCVNSNGQFLTP